MQIDADFCLAVQPPTPKPPVAPQPPFPIMGPQSAPTGSDGNNNNSPLAPWAIGAIVAGSVLGLALIIGVVVWLVRRPRAYQSID
jgi:hypothetical protein